MDQPSPDSRGCDSPPDAPRTLLMPSRSVRSLQGPISRTDRGPTLHTSRTWTTSSGDHGIMSDTDEWEDRASFVQEYNRLATKHGVRILVIEDFDFRNPTNQPTSPRKPSWLRRILRSVSSQPTSMKAPVHQLPRHKRSVSDFAHSLLHRNESPKRLDLQTMVRICGKSTLYLPSEYAPSALILPTSIRATAHYLSQNVPTRGIFRIPGSVRVVNTLYDYYCCIEHGNAGITGTVRCPTLPTHVHASVNDVASTFKRLLSVIPGGILGSLSLFDAFVAVNSQLQGDPELTRTKQSRVRARLIALAVATVESQFRRELICAVFGLLSLVGRHAETTPREDESGRPLPTTDLMGYNALGIVFGPLLLGDMLEHYTMKLAAPKSGLLVLPLRSPKLHKDRRRGRTSETKDFRPPTVDKIHIANTIAEMLISNWRDVVRQMKSLDIHRQEDLPNPGRQHESLPSSQSNFVLAKPQGWDQTWSSGHEEIPREGSPSLATPTPGVSRQRSRSHSSPRSTRLVTRPSVGILSPTVEETSPDDGNSRDAQSLTRRPVSGKGKDGTPCRRPGQVNTSPRPESMPPLMQRAGSTRSRETGETLADVLSGKLEESTLLGFSRRSSLPSRLQSKQRPDPTNASKSKPPKATKDVPIERKNAIRRKKNPAKDKHRKKSGYQPVAVEWPDTTTESSTATDFRDSQSIHLEISEQEALEAAIKAHAEEMKQLEALDAAEHQRNPVSGHHTERQGLPDIKMEEPIQNGENNYFASNVVTQRDSKAPADHASLVPTPREFYSPMQTPLSLTEENVSISTQAQDTGELDEGIRDVQHQADYSGKPPEEIPLPDSPSWVSLIPKRQPLTSLRRCASEAANKPRNVKAIAARFEGGTCSTDSSPPRTKSEGMAHSFIPRFSQQSPAKALRHSSSGSTLGRHSLPNISTPNNSQHPSESPSIRDYELRASIGEKAALRALQLQQSEHSAMLANRQTIPPRKPVPGDNAPEISLQNPPSLGTMIPHPEQPPIAHHLNLVRPSSSSSNLQDGQSTSRSTHDSSTLISRPGSATTLLAQIRTLQRQLHQKTEETLHLRRQLEVQEDADVGTLSQQLREAKREAQMWKERAEAAERRIKVFERFTARLRGIQEAATVIEPHDLSDDAIDTDHEDESREGQTLGRRTTRYESDGSRRTEDAGVVTARIRKCLHGPGKTDGAPDSPPLSEARQAQNVSNRAAKDINQSAVEIWMAAQELLHFEEEQGQRLTQDGRQPIEGDILLEGV
ncbi:uncharacterized protein NECHADRAFT_46451 [Fusarium vanettenii 77-13-4]|uniref:Rho-GAP domain-containing protein n=1 Tax=Fusarium vanettenii (strain ATCC MYA-4622 / CBS 123669 / FGSC 9596 / NRRL 45880 / 77-13-4) TaxID=660122 RepID=C7Z3X9_FUSV7|nr:uncharacterized protein NECHADRAFT_46451 [Fusarium vanettenii 77-13-4]EEU41381.1 hypothetical protein NECHADRAFT_46451 [Fusarium vanettenii 77-13-4]